MRIPFLAFLQEIIYNVPCPARMRNAYIKGSAYSLQEQKKQESFQEKINTFIKSETFLYLVFGVLTTAISIGILKIWTLLFGEHATSVQIGNALAVAVSIAFAFITNKNYVFKNKDWSFASLKKEIPAFLSARLFSFGVEQLGLLIGSLNHVEEHSIFGVSGVMCLKLALNVIVVILNYFASKFVVFRKREK